ncbi:hypothetical protein [Flavobacterium adhaerens]|uniref:hypothetical protein n=1 Tax=Flavobacterium adhaerens TaxID=3149043 RepID=UPI0032B4716B
MIEAYTKNLFIDFTGWFIKLADFAQKADDNSSLPKLELLLHTGNTIRGSIIGYDRARPENVLMILEISDFDAKTRVTLVPSTQVVALTFLDAIQTLTTFKTNVIVSPLELKRTAKKIEEALEKTVSEKINLVLDADHFSEENRSVVLETIELLPLVFESLIEDDLGRNAVVENIKSIKISSAESDAITLENTELHIQKSPLAVFPSKEKERIKKEIESVL